MTPLLAILEFNDYAIIAGIVVVFASAAAYIARPEINLLRLERQLSELQRKLDALLKHTRLTLPLHPQNLP